MGNKISELLASPEADQKSRRAFALMDRDGDGKLTSSEWKQFGIMLFKREEEVKGRPGAMPLRSPHVPPHFFAVPGLRRARSPRPAALILSCRSAMVL